MRGTIDLPSTSEHYRRMAPLDLRAAAVALGVDREFLDFHDRRLGEIDHQVKVAGTNDGQAERVLVLDFELGLRFIDHCIDGRRSYPLTLKGAALAVIRDLRRRGIDILGTPTSQPPTTKEPMPTTEEIDKKPTLTVASAIDTAALSVDGLRALAARLGISRDYMILLSMGFFIGGDKKDRTRGNGVYDLFTEIAERRALAARVVSGEFLKPGARRTLRQEVAMRIYQLRKKGIYVLDDDAPLRRRSLAVAHDGARQRLDGMT